MFKLWIVTISSQTTHIRSTIIYIILQRIINDFNKLIKFLNYCFINVAIQIVSNIVCFNYNI